MKILKIKLELLVRALNLILIIKNNSWIKVIEADIGQVTQYRRY